MDIVYIVTGASGHLGNVLCKDLITSGKRVRGFLVHNEKVRMDGFEKIIYGDIRDKESISPIFHGLEDTNIIVIHCAGIVSITSEFSQILYDVNVIGTKNIVDLSLENNISKLVYVSSVHAIAEKYECEIVESLDFNPNDVIGYYAKTKSEASKYVLEAASKGLNLNIVHPSGIIGPFDYGKGHMTSMISDFYSNKLLVGMNGGYDFVDVRDVVSGIISCVKSGRSGECYILSNKYYTIKELMKMLCEITGKREIRLFFPIWFIKGISPISELYYKIIKQTPLFTRYSVYTLSSNTRFSHEKASRELNYTTRAMEDTLKDTYDWLIKIGRIKRKNS